jgi:hypothetical protein
MSNLRLSLKWTHLLDYITPSADATALFLTDFSPDFHGLNCITLSKEIRTMNELVIDPHSIQQASISFIL